MLKKIFKSISIDQLLYVLVGIAFLLLYSRHLLPDGFVIAGHDSGLPLDSKAFLESRYYAWDDRINFGIDNSHLFGSITLHFIDYISSVISGRSEAGNWANLFLWLSAIFASSLVLGNELRKNFGKFVFYIFPPLVIFNFFIFQSIFILERAKYGILIGEMIFLALVLKLLSGRISAFKASLLSSICFFIFNGGSLLGLPLYGSLFVIIGAVFLFLLLSSLKNRNFEILRKFTYFLLLNAGLLLLLNAYQIVPYFPGIFNNSFALHAGTEGLAHDREWVDYISQNTSFLNIFRMQGVPAWFSDIYEVSLSHPYAKFYVNNLVLLIASFIIPMLAFVSFIFAKTINQKRVILLFSIISLLAMIFSAGTHGAFGPIFGALYENLPGFAIFRTPYYKFAGAVFLASAVLVSVAYSMLTQKIINLDFFKDKPRLAPLLGVFLSTVFVLVWFGYHSSLFDQSKVFMWKDSYSTRVKVPDYVIEFSNWLSQENTKGSKVLALPNLQGNNGVDEYKWGYWSLSPVNYSLTSSPVLINDLSLSREELAWVDYLYTQINDGKGEEFISASRKLGIGYFLYRKDTVGEIEKTGKFLSNTQDIEKIQSFGQWDVYKIKEDRPLIDVVDEVSVTLSGNSFLARDFLKDKDLLTVSEKEIDFIDFSGTKLSNFPCESCVLETINPRGELPPVRVFSNSPFYYLKERKERAALANSKSDIEFLSNYFAFVFRRLSEARSMILLGVDDRYTLKTLNMAEDYLDQAIYLLDKNPNFASDYTVAFRSLSVAAPSTYNTRKLIQTSEFSYRSRNVKDLTYQIVQKLQKASDYFSDLAKDQTALRSQKVFLVNTDDEFYVNIDQLPPNIEGNPNFPNHVYATSGGGTIDAQVSQEGDWMKIKTAVGQESNRLIMDFSLANQLDLSNKKILNSPLGYQGCVYGKTKNFKPGKSYEVSLLPSSKSQKLSIYFQNTLPQNSFLTFRHSIDVSPIETSIPFRHVFESNDKDPDLVVFICSEDRDFPEFSSLALYQIFSPSVISSEVFNPDKSALNPGSADFNKINPTLYKIILKSSDPQILIFNQRYSDLWSLHKENNTNSSLVSNVKDIFVKDEISPAHLSINGYGNAWIIPEQGLEESTWILEYVPQKLFYIGTSLSAVTFIFIIGLLFLKTRKGKNEEIY